MKINNLKYTKDEPSENILESSTDAVSYSGEASPISGLGAEGSHYSKGSPVLDTRIIFILSGGSKREKDYFRPIHNNPAIRTIKIAFRSKKGQGLKPYELKSLAEEFINNKRFVTEDRKSFHIEDNDELYLIQDVDEFGDEIKRYIIEQNSNIRIRWIISNPAFEIWLFYHYFDSPEMLGDCITMSERDRSNWLKEHLNKLIAGGVKTTAAFYSSEIAINNSKNRYAEEDGMPALFSTQMHIVAEIALKIMGEEFSIIKQHRESEIAFYKSLR